MYCSKCGKEIKDDSAFCPYCGEPVGNHVTGSNNQQQANLNTQTGKPGYSYQGAANKQPSNGNHRGPVIAGGIAVLAVICIVIGLIVSSGSGDGNQSASENSDSYVGQNNSNSSSSNSSNSSSNLGANILTQQYLQKSDENGSSSYVVASVLGSDYKPESILNVTFLDSLSYMKDDAWDVSADQDGSVMAWTEPVNNGYYNLYIAAGGGVHANPRSSKLFSGYINVETIDFNNCFYTENMTATEGMFENCSSLTSLDLSGWDTSKVSNMDSMFFGCSSLNSLNVDGWDTSNVNSMEYMFEDCSSLTSLDLNDWNTSKVTSTRFMFTDCSNLVTLDISNWDTSKDSLMQSMFSGCTSLVNIDVSSWNTPALMGMQFLFENCSSLREIDLSSWDITNVTRMDCLFYGCSSLESIVMPYGWESHSAIKTDMFTGTIFEEYNN